MANAAMKGKPFVDAKADKPMVEVTAIDKLRMKNPTRSSGHAS